jgi:hypothetical protein
MVRNKVTKRTNNKKYKLTKSKKSNRKKRIYKKRKGASKLKRRGVHRLVGGVESGLTPKERSVPIPGTPAYYEAYVWNYKGVKYILDGNEVFDSNTGKYVGIKVGDTLFVGCVKL